MLRHLEASDFGALDDLYLKNRAHFRGFVTTGFDREAFDRMMADARLESNEYFVICLPENRRPIGTINLSQIFRKAFQNAYLGYMLSREFTGRGIMTAAVGEILRTAFTRLELHRVEANVQPGNLPSIAVLKRNGFTKEGFSRRYLKIAGRWRDHERWAIIREDWKQAKND